MLFFILSSAIILFGLIFFIKKWLKDNLKESINDYCSGFEDFTKIYAALNTVSEWPDIKRVSIARISNKVITPAKVEKHFIKILYSKGEVAIALLAKQSFLKIDDYYINFVKELQTKNSVSIIVNELPDCELKKICEEVDIKEFYAFKIISSKHKLLYCTISTSKEGSLENYTKEIEKMRSNLLLIIKKNIHIL